MNVVVVPTKEISCISWFHFVVNKNIYFSHFYCARWWLWSILYIFLSWLYTYTDNMFPLHVNQAERTFSMYFSLIIFPTVTRWIFTKATESGRWTKTQSHKRVTCCRCSSDFSLFATAETRRSEEDGMTASQRVWTTNDVRRRSLNSAAINASIISTRHGAAIAPPADRNNDCKQCTRPEKIQNSKITVTMSLVFLFSFPFVFTSNTTKS